MSFICDMHPVNTNLKWQILGGALSFKEENSIYKKQLRKMKDH